MDSRKNRGMGKLFPCFRPDAVDDDCNKAVVGGKVTHSDDGSSSSDGDSSLDEGRRSKGSSRRRLSRAIKAVLFDTSLTRKIRERRSRKNAFRSNSSLSVKTEKIANSISDKSSSMEGSTDVDEMNRINSSRSSSIFSASTNASSSLSSSCSSSRNANSRSSSERRGGPSRDNSMDKGASFRFTNVPVLERKELSRGATRAVESSHKQNSGENKIVQYYSSTVGVCLLLTSLLVLVFWGKICAIFCTSIWLFFVPRRTKGGAISAASMAGGAVDIDSEEYKKRVIMEGLLERNRSAAVAR